MPCLRLRLISTVPLLLAAMAVPGCEEPGATEAPPTVEQVQAEPAAATPAAEPSPVTGASRGSALGGAKRVSESTVNDLEQRNKDLAEQIDELNEEP